MSRLALDISALQVETFAANPAVAAEMIAATYPGCPTATGCTCNQICQSAVGCTATGAEVNVR